MSRSTEKPSRLRSITPASMRWSADVSPVDRRSPLIGNRIVWNPDPRSFSSTASLGATPSFRSNHPGRLMPREGTMGLTAARVVAAAGRAAKMEPPASLRALRRDIIVDRKPRSMLILSLRFDRPALRRRPVGSTAPPDPDAHRHAPLQLSAWRCVRSDRHQGVGEASWQLPPPPPQD